MPLTKVKVGKSILLNPWIIKRKEGLSVETGNKEATFTSDIITTVVIQLTKWDRQWIMILKMPVFLFLFPGQVKEIQGWKCKFSKENTWEESEGVKNALGFFHSIPFFVSRVKTSCLSNHLASFLSFEHEPEKLLVHIQENQGVSSGRGCLRFSLSSGLW